MPIKPTPKDEAFSPLASLVATIRLAALNRHFLAGLNNDQLLEDLAMLCDEGVTIGLRTQWARRVAVPVIFAQRALDSQRGSDQERAKAALDNLAQCTDEAVRTACSTWVRERFNVL